MRRLLSTAILVCALSAITLADGGSEQGGKACDPATQVCTSSTNTVSVADVIRAEVNALLASLGIRIKK
jgi:hypothetical protein